MFATDPKALAQELASAYAQARIITVPPSARGTGFDLASGYAVEGELVRLRRASGRATVGRKVGYANKALWRVLKLETLVWAHMYDDTVHFAGDSPAKVPLPKVNDASLSVGRMCSPKIEPEIVFKVKQPLGDGISDAASVLQAVEWLALGFEIIDCVYADWKFQPSDFVAAFGLHAGLIVGTPRRVEPELIPLLVEQLPLFKVSLLKEGQVVAGGTGRNSLRSPALCLGELASAISRRSDVEPLATGELISSGSLTDAQPLAPNGTWSATLDGLDLPALTLRTLP